VLGILIALNNPLTSAGFKPANFGSNGKKDDTTDNDNDRVKTPATH
jgi:hypothetical protein